MASSSSISNSTVACDDVVSGATEQQIRAVLTRAAGDMQAILHAGRVDADSKNFTDSTLASIVTTVLEWSDGSNSEQTTSNSNSYIEQTTDDYPPSIENTAINKAPVQQGETAAGRDTKSGSLGSTHTGSKTASKFSTSGNIPLSGTHNKETINATTASSSSEGETTQRLDPSGDRSPLSQALSYRVLDASGDPIILPRREVLRLSEERRRAEEKLERKKKKREEREKKRKEKKERDSASASSTVGMPQSSSPEEGKGGSSINKSSPSNPSNDNAERLEKRTREESPAAVSDDREHPAKKLKCDEEPDSDALVLSPGIGISNPFASSSSSKFPHIRSLHTTTPSPEAGLNFAVPVATVTRTNPNGAKDNSATDGATLNTEAANPPLQIHAPAVRRLVFEELNKTKHRERPLPAEEMLELIHTESGESVGAWFSEKLLVEMEITVIVKHYPKLVLKDMLRPFEILAYVKCGHAWDDMPAAIRPSKQWTARQVRDIVSYITDVPVDLNFPIFLPALDVTLDSVNTEAVELTFDFFADAWGSDSFEAYSEVEWKIAVWQEAPDSACFRELQSFTGQIISALAFPPVDVSSLSLFDVPDEERRARAEKLRVVQNAPRRRFLPLLEALVQIPNAAHIWDPFALYPDPDLIYYVLFPLVSGFMKYRLHLCDWDSERVPRWTELIKRVIERASAHESILPALVRSLDLPRWDELPVNVNITNGIVNTLVLHEKERELMLFLRAQFNLGEELIDEDQYKYCGIDSETDDDESDSE